MQDNDPSNPHEPPPPGDAAAGNQGYSTFHKIYLALTALMVIAVLSAGGWGIWRHMTSGFMSSDLAALMETVETGDADEAAAAADEIADLGYSASAAIPFLIEIAADPVSPNRVTAVEILGRLEASSDEAIAVLGDAAGDSNEAVRHAALRALSQVGAPAATVTDAIAEQLAADNPETRRLAARALGTIDFMEIAAEDALVAALDDPDPGVQAAALSALVQTGAELPDGAIGLLTGFMASPDAEIRGDAILALGLLGPEAAELIPAIEAALSDESSDIRDNAAWALARMGEARAARSIPLLARTLETDENTDVRAQAAWALGQLGAASENATDALQAALDDAEEAVRLEAYRSLKDLIKVRGGDFLDLEEVLGVYGAKAGACKLPE